MEAPGACRLVRRAHGLTSLIREANSGDGRGLNLRASVHKRLLAPGGLAPSGANVRSRDARLRGGWGWLQGPSRNPGFFASFCGKRGSGKSKRGSHWCPMCATSTLPHSNAEVPTSVKTKTQPSNVWKNFFGRRERRLCSSLDGVRPASGESIGCGVSVAGGVWYSLFLPIIHFRGTDL